MDFALGMVIGFALGLCASVVVVWIVGGRS